MAENSRKGREDEHLTEKWATAVNRQFITEGTEMEHSTHSIIQGALINCQSRGRNNRGVRDNVEWRQSPKYLSTKGKQREVQGTVDKSRHY